MKVDEVFRLMAGPGSLHISAVLCIPPRKMAVQISLDVGSFSKASPRRILVSLLVARGKELIEFTDVCRLSRNC